MAKRPPLSEDTFLAHLFSPKKHAQPSGIRKTTLKGTKGQKKARVAAFNRMSPFNQELLKRSGQRDAYLRGEGTLANAKASLRPSAIAKRLAHPLRGKPVRGGQPTNLDIRVASYLKYKLAGNVEKYNPETIDNENEYLGLNADEGMLRWDTGRIKAAGKHGSEYEVIGPDGKVHNPFWYH